MPKPRGALRPGHTRRNVRGMTDFIPRVVDISHPYKGRGLTPDRVRELLDYDQDTGILRWKVRSGPRPAGSIAGSINQENGYRYIGVDGCVYLAHCLIFLHVLGRWPTDEVDHGDLNHANNAWTNLREAVPQQNCANRPKRSDSGHPYKGISRKGRKWRAQIVINRRRQSLGYFDTPEAAHEAYVTAAKAVHGEFARAA
jgi:hypothetical protein